MKNLTGLEVAFRLRELASMIEDEFPNTTLISAEVRLGKPCVHVYNHALVEFYPDATRGEGHQCTHHYANVRGVTVTAVSHD